MNNLFNWGGETPEQRQARLQWEQEILLEQARMKAMAMQAGATGGGGGSGTFSYPDRVSVEIPGFGSGFLCNTGDFYNDGDTPIYYGEITISGRPSSGYMYYNGTNWGVDSDLNPPFNAIGSANKQDIYGTYAGAAPGAPDVIVSAYSGDPDAVCPSLPGGETTATILQGETWTWQNITPLGPSQWSVTGTIGGLVIDGSTDNELAGQFILTDMGSGIWGVSNSGPGTAVLNPSSSAVTLISVLNATTTGGDPSVDLSGNWTPSKFTGLVTYTPSF